MSYDVDTDDGDGGEVGDFTHAPGYQGDPDSDDRDVERSDWTPTLDQMVKYHASEDRLALVNVAVMICTSPPRSHVTITNGLSAGYGFASIGVIVDGPELDCQLHSAHHFAKAMGAVKARASASNCF